MKANALVLFACALAVTGTAYAGRVLLGVPDWQQPGDPAPGYNVPGYPNWCVPTATADLMGYWEDQRGATGLSDTALPGASPAYANNLVNAPLWQQGLWHDATVEIGWFQDTGGWQSVPRGFPPNVGNTALNNIGPGAIVYAQTAWNDATTGLAKVAYANASTTRDIVLNFAMWQKYMTEISNNRPVLVSFKGWAIVPGNPGSVMVDGQSCELWPMQIQSEGHTVCGVGFSDPTPAALNGDELMVVQDTWSSTGQLVAVSPTLLVGGNQFWMQNDYITIPEPATLALLALGGLVVLRRRKH